MRYEDTSGSISSSATPEARNDADTLPNGSAGPATGNVITGAGTDTGKAGADTAAGGHIVEVRGASGTDSAADGGKMNVDGRFGTLAIDDDGNYKYVAEGHAPQNFRDIFQYTLANAKGGRDTADLVISRGGEIKVADNAQRVVPGPDGVVTLPEGVNLNNVQVLGRDLIVTLPDGSQMIIVDGAVFVPQLVINGVEVPATNLAALMIDTEAVRTVAGPPQSSGGNFDVPVPPLDPGVPLGDLIPPTELAFTPPTFEESGQVLDRDPEIEIQPEDQSPSVAAEDSVNEKGLPTRNGGEPAGSGEIADGNASNNSDGTETTTGTILITSPDGVDSVTINGVVVTGAVGQTISGAFGTLTITGFSGQNILYSYTLGDNTTGDATHDDFSVTITDDDGDQATATLTIDIIDDVPTARPDTDSIAAGQFGPATGNVITDASAGDAGDSDSGADTVGADNATITSVSSVNVPANSDNSGPFVVNGQYGVLTLQADGSYSYVRNPGTPGGVNDVFNYTLTDGDGDTSTTTLTISIGDATPQTGENPLIRFDDDALPGGNPGGVDDDNPDTVNASGTLAGSGGDGPITFAVQTTGAPAGFSYVSGGAGVVLIQQNGTTVLTVTVQANGSYTVVQNAPIDHPAGSNENNVVFTINYTVTDQDNDSAAGSFTINVDDDTPVVSIADRGEPSLTVDESDLATNASASFAANFSASFGADGPAAAGSLTYALGINAGATGLIDVATGQPIVLVLNGGVVEGHVGNAAGALAFTVSVDATGTVTLDQIRALQHPDASNPDDSVTFASDALVTLTATATDGDGDTDSETLNIGQNLAFEDDGPSISASSTQPTLTVDETVLATNASASFASVFTSSFGADGAGTITYALGTAGGASGLVDTATGQPIVLVNNAGVIEGHVGNAAGALAFTVSIDANTGVVTLDQIRAVVHADPTNHDDATTLSGDGLVTITATITDRDGDQATATANIGQNLVFEDDGPAITLSGTEASLTVDETNLAINAGPTSFASAFTPAFGADGAAAANSLTYALGITGGNGTNSGLVDTATDEAVLLVNNGGVIEGRTANSNLLVFTVSVDAAGNVSLDQIRAVVHPNTANPDDSITLSADNLITLTATATDGDGDQASATLNIGQNLNFEDDGPSANNDTDVTNPATDTAVGNVITGVGTTEGAANADAPGADGFGSITNLVGSSTSDNDPTGGFTAVGTHGTLQMDANGNYTYTRTGGVGGSTDTFTYTYVDGDGDPATATLVITIADENPVAGNVNVLLDDDVIPGANGNPDGPGDDNPDVVGQNTTGGTLPGSGGNGTLTFSFGTNVAPAGFTYDTSTPGTLLIKQDGTTVVTVTIASDGTYTVTQNAPISHATGGDENNQPFTINYVVTDADGDPANGTISIDVDDDSPVISASTTQPQLTVDETVLATNATASFAGVFTSSFGADGPGTLTYALAITGGNGVNSGLIDVATGQNIVLVNNAGVIEGHVGNAAGALAFTVTVDGSGNVTLDQIRAVTHPDPSNPDDSVTLANDNLVTLTATITDEDGDSQSATANIGQNLNFEDDGPSITATGTQPSLTVDETNLAINATASFAGIFSPSFGADGAAAANSLTYALAITGGNGVNSGLIDVATGQNIVLVNNAGVIEGHVGNAAGALAFTVSVDGSGNVTLDQIRAVTHPDPTNPDDSVTLASDNLITLTATATDRDGDQASATANIGQNLNFEDDGPSISATGVEPQLTVDETNLAINASASFAANFNSAFGADGAGTVGYALTITGGNGVNSGLIDVATGQNIVLVNNAGVIEGHVGNAAGALAFTVTVDGSGLVTLDQIRAVTHPDATNPDDSVTLAADNLIVLTATVTDRDGDSQSASINIGQNLNFEDDGPSATIVETGQGVSVDESVGIQVDSNDTTNAAIIALFAGVSNPGSDTDLPQYATNASAVVASTGSTYGADGAGTTAFSLNVSSAGVDSGLNTTDGTDILLYKEGNLIVGRAGSQAGPAAFAIAIDPVTGQISMVEYLSIQHPNAANPDDAVSIADGAVQAVVTVTDRDGDSVTSSPTNIGSLISFQDSAPVMTAAQNMNIQNSGDVAHTAAFAFNLGADGAATNNDVITNVTGSATVGGVPVTNWSLVPGAETATTATYTFSFNYPVGGGNTAQATGTLTFDKVAGTYTIDLANPIQGVTTILQTAQGTLFQGYEFGTSTPDGSQPEISVTQIQDLAGTTNDIYVQFTGVAEPSSGTGDNNLEVTNWVPGADNPPPVNGGGDMAWNAGQLFNQEDSWVSTSNSANGVAGDTIQGGEVLDFTLVQGANPTGNLAQPGTFAQASAMFLKFDGIGSAEDMIVILKLYDPTTNTYTTRAIMVENSDIQKGPGAGPGQYSGVTLDNNDGLVIIESNDYNQPGENWVIVGAQVAGSDEGVTGTAINLNSAIGAAGDSDVDNNGSLDTDALGFQSDTDDGPFKISSIGFLTTQTTPQNAELTFNVTVTDGDGDSITQTVSATITPNADSVSAATIPAGNTTVSAAPLNPKSTAMVADSYQPAQQQTTTNSNAVLMGAFAAAGLAASQSVAAETIHGDLNSSVSSLATAAYHSQNLAPIGLDSVGGGDAFGAMPALGMARAIGGSETAAIHSAPEQMVAHSLIGMGGEAAQPAAAAFAQDTMLPAHDGGAMAAMAPVVAMPSAQQLAALANSVGEAQHNQVVGQVLADALHGGGGAPVIEAALNALPGHGGGNEALAALASHNAAGVPISDSSAFGGFTAAHSAFTMEAAMVHVDAVQPNA